MTVPCYKPIGGGLSLTGCRRPTCCITSSISVEMFILSLGGFAPDSLPVEAKPVWHKQAIELEEEVVVTEEPT